MNPILAQLAAEDPLFGEQLELLTGYSRYAERKIDADAAWIVDRWQHGAFSGTLCLDGLLNTLREKVDGDWDEVSLMEQLRQTRHRALLLIMWRDLARVDSIEQTLAGHSALAGALIDVAVKGAQTLAQARLGVPRDHAGQPMSLVVLGMGKLGGGELNFSSDVDLMFAFPEAGTTDGPRQVSCEEYFAWVVRKTVHLLNTVTEHGFVYRVDLRLRPYGDAGRLALSFDAMEQYYLREGRDWERYALQKATPVAGDLHQGAELLRRLSTFVYRRYVDFSVFEALREMKTLIAANGIDRDRDIKLGPGGIREIEFLTQAFQLVRGGRQPGLRMVSVIPALIAVGERGLLPEAEVDQLIAAYRFLRLVENRLQHRDDQQTHLLPGSADDLEQLARVSGFTIARELTATLDEHRARVNGIFNRTFAPINASAADQWEWKAWHLRTDHAQLAHALGEMAFQQPAAAAEVVTRFSQAKAVSEAGVKGRALIDQLLPLLLHQVALAGGASSLLDDVLTIVASICRRTAYLALLLERPQVLERLVWVCAHSTWLTERVKQQPGLMDDLVAPAPAEGRVRLGRQLELAGRAAGEDGEQRLMALCQFQQSEMVAIAMAFLRDGLSATHASGLLSQLAEVLLARVLELAEDELLARYGSPGNTGFGVIGFGTLGARDMRFDSDLDLVFLTGDDTDDAMTSGSTPVPVARYYTRLVQRLLSMLSLRSPFGRLYEVDTRLRPNGNAGFLVSSVSAYERYQLESAWVWEWQALVRSRCVAGVNEIEDRFEQIRRKTLSLPRDGGSLRDDIVAMRKKMQQEVSGAGQRQKFRPGARLDIEFLAQYLCLANASSWPEFVTARGTAELLEEAGRCGLLSATQLNALQTGYESAVHAELCISLGAEVRLDTSNAEDGVSEVWRQVMGD